jgi:ribose 5-phosphate isomerase A
VSQQAADQKRLAAHSAVELLRPGMVVGLGHGTTAAYAVRRIADLCRAGQLDGIVAVPCSRQVEMTARRLGIPLTSFSDHPVIDVTIDGADEVAPSLDLIKGGGGALLREKIVAQASLREVIVVDESKLSPMLGTGSVVPVEVVPFGWSLTCAYIGDLGGTAERRVGPNGGPVSTDQGNYVLDCCFGPINDPSSLAAALDRRAGVVAHGLFLGLATDLIVAGGCGLRHQTRLSGRDS